MNEDLRASIMTLEADMKRLLFILDNDPGTGRSGLVKDVDMMKKTLEAVKTEIQEIKVESKMSKILWGSSGGVIGVALWKIISVLFT